MCAGAFHGILFSIVILAIDAVDDSLATAGAAVEPSGEFFAAAAARIRFHPCYCSSRTALGETIWWKSMDIDTTV